MLDTDRLCPGCMHDTAGERVCSLCGYDSTVDNPQEYLPIKYRLSARYLVGRMTALDCEGVTYIGFDAAQNKTVDIKEYFPSGVAHRNPDKTVSMVSDQAFAYNEGLMQFTENGRSLIQSELPSLIPTLACFEENGTAYKISERPSGITLEDFLERNGSKLRFEQVRPLFLPLIDTVRGLNEMGIIHGGISPETIIVGRDGKLRLTDLFIPAARKSGGAVTPELYAGFAALEQYGAEGELSGATDVYALCATLFRVLVGNTLPPACERVGNAGMSIPASLADQLPRQVLVSLANGLQVAPSERTATVEKFKNELVYGETEENLRRAEIRKTAADSAKAQPKPKKSNGAKYAAIAAVCTVLVFIIVGLVLMFTVFKDQIFKPDEGIVSSEEDYVLPSTPSVGEYDAEAVESVRLYPVPDFLGKYYSEIIDNDEYVEDFKLKIKNVKEYSDKYPKGTVCAQSVAAGKEVEKETEIILTISLGPAEVKVPNVLGFKEAEAKVELLKAGFLYENIEVVEKYDVESPPGVVLEQTPKAGTAQSTEILVRIYINSFDGAVDDEDAATGFVVGDGI